MAETMAAKTRENLLCDGLDARCGRVVDSGVRRSAGFSRPRALVASASDAWATRGSRLVKRGTNKDGSRSREGEGEESRREGNERKDGE